MLCYKSPARGCRSRETVSLVTNLTTQGSERFCNTVLFMGRPLASLRLTATLSIHNNYPAQETKGMKWPGKKKAGGGGKIENSHELYHHIDSR